jgi:hypothetical protein
MSSFCSFCKKEILVKQEHPNGGDSDLCLDCVLTFISGDRPDRRRTERRRYTANPELERRGQSDRRRN